MAVGTRLPRGVTVEARGVSAHPARTRPHAGPDRRARRGGPVTTISPGRPGAPAATDGTAGCGRTGGPPPGAELLESLLAATAEEDRPVTHVHSVPVRERRTLPWPEWVGD